jgi:hypothetical protein
MRKRPPRTKLSLRGQEELADLDRLQADGEQGGRGGLEFVALEFEDAEREQFAQVGR